MIRNTYLHLRPFLFSSLFVAMLAPVAQATGNEITLSSTPSDSLVFELEEVVVQAFNRKQDLVTVPGSITHLGVVLIHRESPAINILPVLQYIPGVFAQEGGMNTSRVTIRGTGARVPYATGKIRGYFNNIPLTNMSGVTFIEDIDPAVIQSLDVIKGPAPGSYGAGLGGTIIISSRDPLMLNNSAFNHTQAGSFGLIRNSAGVTLSNGTTAGNLVYSHTQTDGYRQNNQLRRDALTFTAHHNPNETTRFTSLFSLSDLRSFIPSSIDSITFMNDPTAAAANWNRTRGYEDGIRAMAGLNAHHAFSQKFTTDVSVFGIWHDEKEMRPFDVFYQQRSTMGSRLNLAYISTYGLEYSAGGEIFSERYQFSNYENTDEEGAQGEQMTENREKVVSYSVFAQADANFGTLKVSGGVNFNYIFRDYRDLFDTGPADLSGTYNYGTIVSPRLAASYNYIANQWVYAGVSHGFAPPSLEETLTDTGTINPEILPEKSWNFETGVRGKLLNGRLFYDVTLYRMLITDLLVAERTAEDTWIGRNAGEALHNGLETELHWMMTRNNTLGNRFWDEISLRTNYTFNHFRFSDFIDRENDWSGNTIPGVPDHVWYAGMFFQTRHGFYLMPSGRYAGKMALNDANSRFSYGYWVSDVIAGMKTELFQRASIDLYFRINNIFNTHYASMVLVNAPSFGNNAPRYYYPGLPVHFNAGLRVSI